MRRFFDFLGGFWVRWVCYANYAGVGGAVEEVWFWKAMPKNNYGMFL